MTMTMTRPSSFLRGVATRHVHTMARQLRDNQDLARFVIEGEANGKQLGTGSYGSVEEVSSK
jgi:hypothetical protein